MYKNISLTHSLLLLLFFIPSALLSMEGNLLEQSVIMPENKGLGLWGGLMYALSDEEQVLIDVIKELKTGTFDATNGSNIKRLNEAFKTACKKEDPQLAAKLLLTIAELCNGNAKYAGVRITDDKLAKEGFEVVSKFYLSELEFAQKEQLEREQWDQRRTAILNSIKNIHETISIKDDAMKNKHHDPENVTKKVKSLKLLNRTIRNPIDDLLANNQQPKTTILSPTKNKTPDELISVLTNLNQTIGDIGPKQKIILALEDQK